MENETTNNKANTIPTGDKTQEETQEVRSNTIVDKAVIAADRLEKANARTEELLRRQESLAAKNALAGTAEAGAIQEVKEETPAEYKAKVMSGELNV